MVKFKEKGDLMSIIIMILLLSVLILVHEAGHFLAARMFGIKVDKFGFGLPIGPTLFKKKCGDVEVLVHAFLLGGYVSFPDDDKDSDLPLDSEERFANKPVYQRLIVVSAGVAANVLCAILIVILTAALWKNLPSGQYNVILDEIVAPKTESIWDSGIQKNDRIVKVNGVQINNAYSFLKIIELSKKQNGLISQNLVDENLRELRRLNPALLENEIIPPDVAIKLPPLKYEAPVTLTEMAAKGAEYPNSNHIKLEENLFKLRNDLEGKQTYVSDGRYTLSEIAKALSDNVSPLYIQVKRSDELIDLKPIYPNIKGQIGAKLKLEEKFIKADTPKKIILSSAKYLVDNTYMMIYGLGQIFTNKIPLTDLHGIIAITKLGGDIIDNSGIFSGLLLTALISMNLAIINLLPIPALDGGHIMFLLIEKLRGKPLNEAVIERIGSVFFMLLILLMVFVIFNDIFALVTNKF